MRCKTCKLEKTTSEFYSYGYGTCKTFFTERNRNWRKNNPEKQRESYRLYVKNHPELRLARQKARIKNRTHRREYMREYYRIKGKIRAMDYSATNREWQKQNPEKVATHMAVKKAVKQSILVRPTKCSQCAFSGRIQGHHSDYSKPLEIEWLCFSCHRLKHSLLTENK